MFDQMTVLNYITIFTSWYAITYTATRYSHLIYSALPATLHNRFVHNTKLFDCTFAAHRGGAAERPENTLAAFTHAASLGCQLLELDVHMTADKQVVVAHDITTERVCERSVDITKTNYSDLPRIKRTGLLLTPPFHSHGNTLDYVHSGSSSASTTQRTVSERVVDSASDASTVKAGKFELNNEVSEHDTYRMPLLSEVFERLPQCAVNIDLKDNDDELLHETYKVIKQHNRQRMVAWGSTRDNTCQLCYKTDPTVPLFFSAKQVLLLHIKYTLGILPFCHIKERMLDIPLITAPFERNAMTAMSERMGANSYKFMGVKLFIKFYQYISSRSLLYTHLRSRGINTCFWVLQTDEEFEQAYRLGAAGIMTDFPQRLHDYLIRNGKLKASTG